MPGNTERNQPAASGRRKLATGYQPPAVEGLPDEQRRFLEAGSVGAATTTTGAVGRPPTPATQPAKEVPQGAVTALIPKPLYNWLLLATSNRKATDATLSRQRDIVAAALNEWLQKSHPDLRPKDWDGRVGE